MRRKSIGMRASPINFHLTVKAKETNSIILCLPSSKLEKHCQCSGLRAQFRHSEKEYLLSFDR